MKLIKEIFGHNVKQTVEGLEMEIEDINTTNIVEMLNNLQKYMIKNKGYLKESDWRGMLNSPIETKEVYSYKHAEFIVYTKRMKYYQIDEENNQDYRHIVKLTFTSRKPSKSIVREFCRSCFKHYLVP
jgi:hypothetical protein